MVTYPHALPRPPSAGTGCECFLEHRTATDVAVPMNEYTVVGAWDATVVCGVRPTDPDATTILLCEWRVNISDYTDDTNPPAPAVRYGYGVYATQNSLWIAGSHGFIEWQDGLDGPWQGGIANLPAGTEWPDALTSGSFAVPLNVSYPAATFDIACVLGVYNAGAGSASFYVETYEYALCGCACPE